MIQLPGIPYKVLVVTANREIVNYPRGLLHEHQLQLAVGEIAIYHDVYLQLKNHNCQSYLILDSMNKRRAIRSNTEMGSLLSRISYHIRNIDGMLVHQYYIVMSGISGGLLLGFESDDDAVLFKLKYM